MINSEERNKFLSQFYNKKEENTNEKSVLSRWEYLYLLNQYKNRTNLKKESTSQLEKEGQQQKVKIKKIKYIGFNPSNLYSRCVDWKERKEKNIKNIVEKENLQKLNEEKSYFKPQISDKSLYTKRSTSNLSLSKINNEKSYSKFIDRTILYRDQQVNEAHRNLSRPGSGMNFKREPVKIVEFNLSTNRSNRRNMNIRENRQYDNNSNNIQKKYIQGNNISTINKLRINKSQIIKHLVDSILDSSENEYQESKINNKSRIEGRTKSLSKGNFEDDLKNTYSNSKHLLNSTRDNLSQFSKAVYLLHEDIESLNI